MNEVDTINPSFYLFPVNNNRTAWRPYGLPVILIVPNKRDPVGFPISNSDVFNVRVVIEGTPREALVAGHDHIGLRYPDRELYSEELTTLDLATYNINLDSVTILRNDETVLLKDAQYGDFIDYTTATGVRNQIPFLPGADYYDLSSIKIEVETLPSNDYVLSYQANYYERISTQDELKQFVCVNPNTTQLCIIRSGFQHPGKVIEEFYRSTPEPYLTNIQRKSEDQTVGLYRILTDPLQDIHDEQRLLENINWVYDASPQMIPYLSALLGWDLPYFPRSLDQLRKAVLRRTVEFQNLKGSKQVITEVFRLFGYEILISSLWWSSDGKRLIRPDETLPEPYTDQQIKIDLVDQIDAGLSDIVASTDIKFTIPLVYRPQVKSGLDQFVALADGGNVTIDAYLVEYDTTPDSAYNKLLDISQDIASAPDTYGNIAEVNEDGDGFLNPTVIHDIMAGEDILGYSQLLISGSQGKSLKEILVGQYPPLLSLGAQLNRSTNNLDITLNGYFDTRDDYRVFLFITYRRLDIIVPNMLKYMQSNKFDIQVLTKDNLEYADPVTLEFALEFLYRLKAFHSLLNTIKTRAELNETYQVTDLCVGGNYQQRYDTDIGMLQVPPAIIPNVPTDLNDCTKLDPTSLGYKEADILYRNRVLSSNLEEFNAWQSFSGRPDSPYIGRLKPAIPAESSGCQYNYYGQDRVPTSSKQESESIEYIAGPNANKQTGLGKLSPINESDTGDYDAVGPSVSENGNTADYGLYTKSHTIYPNTFCELDGITDYCYKGRVNDELLYRPVTDLSETFRSKPCALSMGSGVYYTYPRITIMAVPGTETPDNGSKTKPSIFSGGSDLSTIEYYSKGIAKDYLHVDKSLANLPTDSSLLGRLYRSYYSADSITLHYNNRQADVSHLNQSNYLALQRPSLDIAKPTMHFPGCSFPKMHALQSDYVNTALPGKPWDDAYSTGCGPTYVCGSKPPSYLNATFSYDTNGDEILVYDDVDYRVEGNGLQPDILNLMNELEMSIGLSEDEIIHKVYMHDNNMNNYIEFDGVCDYDTSSPDGFVETNNPLFNSHNKCSLTSDSFIDFANGYACITGLQNYSRQQMGLDGDYDDLLSLLGLPISDTTGGFNLLFTLGSGILTNEPAYRLDCGCTLANCDEQTNSLSMDTICSALPYLTSDNEYDWSLDGLDVTPVMQLDEVLGISSDMLDGSIRTMLETV